MRPERRAGAEVGLDLPRVVTAEVTLARAFLATLPDQRLPWSARYETWADEQELSLELKRSVKTTILRLRIFHTIERSARRRPSGR